MLAELIPLAYIAKSGNPNILTHREAMKADDNEKFLESMLEEIENLLLNKYMK